ncbi:UNVERIFIED_ORG: hypothetical protein ABIC43_000230 [Variovorax guangxiensis]
MERLALAFVILGLIGCAAGRASRMPPDFNESVAERVSRCGSLIGGCGR